MNWYRENRWLGNFLIVSVGCLFLAGAFLFYARGEFTDASMQFNLVAIDRTRLENLVPFPNDENFRKTQVALERYTATLDKTKTDLKAQTVPASPLAPNEFQSRLRQAILDVTERARVNRVKLPANFCLGFDEFTGALPDTSASPLLGQQLAQVELLINILIDNRVDVITSLDRPVPSMKPAANSSAVAQKSKIDAQPSSFIRRTVVDISFNASPSVLRKVLNQVASFDRQFFIVRMLHVRNEQQKGASRDQGAVTASTTPTGPTSSGEAIKFFVGNEHVETTATVELVAFNF